jgi:hypothetical protein
MQRNSEPGGVGPTRAAYANMRSVTSQGHAYAQFKRALRGGHVMQAWTLAAELPQVSLADALELLLLARES